MQTPLHPMIVHLPMALSILLPLLAGGLYLATRRGWLPGRTWALVVAAQALLVGSGFLALQTGEEDEERVERVVAEAALDQHEDAAEVFVLGSGLALAVAVLPLLLGRSRWAGAARLATLLATVGVLGLGYRVGKAGGELVYRHGAATAFAEPRAAAARLQAPPPPSRRSHDEDDH